MSKKPSLVQRSISSVSWNMVANVMRILVGFLRSVLLARLLPVEVFGIYAFANSIVTLSGVGPNLGMGGALVHHAPETEDEEQAAAIHFTLELIFTSVWAALLIAGAFVFVSGQTLVAVLLLTITGVGSHLVHTPQLILARRVVHRRLALAQTIDILLSAIVALSLAWQGVTLWALLATNLVTLFVNVVAHYVWRPVWRPRLAWSPPIVRYFLRFGSRNFAAIALLRALDRVDDLWVGAYLGDTAMGFYSRSYAFATYPRQVLAAPVNMVAGGTYAELKGDRKRLSKAFFRTNALLVRSGFFMAGLLALIAPEFIRLLLGTKWLPMLNAFRLMLVFTLLDPIRTTVGNLFVSLGRPEQVVRARLVQLAVLAAGMFSLGPYLGIAGVAMATDAMLVVGIGLMLWQARGYVDYSWTRLFGVPTAGLFSGLLLARLAITLPGILGSDWRTAAIKMAVFIPVYGGSLLMLERESISMLVNILDHLRLGILRTDPNTLAKRSPDKTH